MNLGDVDPALMEWFLGGQVPRMRKDSAASPAQARRGPARSGVDRTEDLRALGFNRPEREALLRPRPAQRRQGDTDRRRAIMRLEHYIDQWVDWNTTDLDRREVVALWAVFVHHNVDKAKWWWEQAGVHPLQIHRLKEFTENGFTERDLGVVIDGGKTVLEHLLARQNVKWCVDSLAWHNRSQRL